MLVRGDVFRARYRKGFERPVPMRPGKAELICFDMPDVAHWFLPGHKVMVQIQSSWFPLIDMNPQRFIANIYDSEESDYTKTAIRAYHQRNMPSCIELHVVGK